MVAILFRPHCVKAYLWIKSLFLPEASMAIRYCRCLRLFVRPCVNHLLVRAITRDPFKLGSPNLNHRCKRPWLRSLLFWGVIDLYLQGQINLWSQNLPHFELVRPITHHPFKPGPPNLDQMFKIPWLRSLLFWGLIELDMSNLTYFQNPVYLHRFCVFEIFVRLAKTNENVVCSTSHIAAHVNVRPQGRVMDWNSRVVSFVLPLLASQSSTRRLAMDFWMLL